MENIQKKLETYNNIGDKEKKNKSTEVNEEEIEVQERDLTIETEEEINKKQSYKVKKSKNE